jgi:hypothetical protein
MAEWLRSGLQSRLHRFDSGWRLFSVDRCRTGHRFPATRFGNDEVSVFEPMLVILAPPAAVFAYVLYDLRRTKKPAPAPVAAAPEPAASPAWDTSVSAAA